MAKSFIQTKAMRTLGLYLALLFITSRALASLSDLELWRKDPVTDKICTTQPMINLGTAMHSWGCGLQCGNEPGCVGFFFNENERSCQGSSLAYTDLTVCDTVPGNIYYAKGCDPPPRVTSASINIGYLVAGSTRLYTCVPGYVMSGTITSTMCQPDGTWTPTDFQCVSGCSAPPVVPNANILAGDVFEGTIRMYVCQPGFVTSDLDLTVTCQQDGTWTSAAFSCVAGCSAPPVVQNANVLAGDVVEGSIRTYTCVSGYASTDPTLTVTCQVGGAWTAVDFTCDVACSYPPAEPYAAVLPGDIVVGSVRTYTCNTGYTMSGTPSITCQAGGTWSTAGFTCEAGCGTPSPMPNAVVSLGEVIVGSVRTYTCNSGYTMSGTPSTTCQSDATWSAVGFTCVAGCGAPPPMSNAAVSSGDVIVGSVRTYTCNSGYTMSGTPSTTCQSDGIWSAVGFTCVAGCGAPPPMSNAAVSSGDVIVGSVRTYTCNSGYTMSGTPSITCQYVGTWSAVGFTCVAATCATGWHQISDSCYFVDNPNTKMAYQAARDFCVGMSSYLVQPETAAENSALKSWLQSTYGNYNWWIGLTDDGSEGSWRYINTNAAATYMDWNANEPDGGTVENYMILWDTFAWSDVPVNADFAPICEKSTSANP